MTAALHPEFACDADLTHPWASQYRIPVVTSPYVRWAYEVALVVPGEPSDRFPNPYKATWPTDAEAALIGSVIDFRRDYYNENHKQQMLTRPLDVDGTTNPLILIRREEGWAYRWETWTMGPLFVESPVPGADCAGLRALLDRQFTDDRWKQWRAERLDQLVAFT